MTSPSVILRKWTGRIRTAQQDEYVAYIAGTGIEDYAKTPGNLGFQMLLRELGRSCASLPQLRAASLFQFRNLP